MVVLPSYAGRWPTETLVLWMEYGPAAQRYTEARGGVNFARAR